jgi:hypothetical protein
MFIIACRDASDLGNHAELRGVKTLKLSLSRPVDGVLTFLKSTINGVDVLLSESDITESDHEG